MNQIWHIVVQSRQRIDLNATLGGSVNIDLAVRGDRFSRRAHAHSSHRGVDKVVFEPKSVFQLVPGAFNRVGLQITSQSVGSK